MDVRRNKGEGRSPMPFQKLVTVTLATAVCGVICACGSLSQALVCPSQCTVVVADEIEESRTKPREEVDLQASAESANGRTSVNNVGVSSGPLDCRKPMKMEQRARSLDLLKNTDALDRHRDQSDGSVPPDNDPQGLEQGGVQERGHVCSELWREYSWLFIPVMIIVLVKFFLARQPIAVVVAWMAEVLAFLLTHTTAVALFVADQLRGLAHELRETGGHWERRGKRVSPPETICQLGLQDDRPRHDEDLRTERSGDRWRPGSR